ncbi:MAG: hypothetical protein PUC05_08175 [Firmicutes bacterium]|nr:hypothetical protein [Bacillota bacterium]
MYEQERRVVIDTDGIIKLYAKLSELYSRGESYESMRAITDYIDGQTVDYIRCCVNPYEAVNRCRE